MSNCRAIALYRRITVLYRRIDQCHNSVTMSSYGRVQPCHTAVSISVISPCDSGISPYHCITSPNHCVISVYLSMSFCRIDQCHMCHITVSISVIAPYRSVSYRRIDQCHIAVSQRKSPYAEGEVTACAQVTVSSTACVHYTFHDQVGFTAWRYDNIHSI